MTYFVEKILSRWNIFVRGILAGILYRGNKSIYSVWYIWGGRDGKKMDYILMDNAVTNITDIT